MQPQLFSDRLHHALFEIAKLAYRLLVHDIALRIGLAQRHAASAISIKQPLLSVFQAVRLRSQVAARERAGRIGVEHILL